MWKSSTGVERVTPVNPPKMNEVRKPRVNSIGVSYVIDTFHMVPIQLKNFTPVGTAISIVMKAKNSRMTVQRVYMWWAHTVTDRAAIAIVAPTRVLYPKIGLRHKAEMIAVAMPKDGITSTYTSGCPKDQKRCCHRIGPPFSGSMVVAAERRAAPRASKAEASGGKAISTSTPVIRGFQVKIGMRNIVIPGMRMVMIVVMMLTEPRIVPKPCRARPNTHRSPPSPGVNVVSDSGA